MTDVINGIGAGTSGAPNGRAAGATASTVDTAAKTIGAAKALAATTTSNTLIPRLVEDPLAAVVVTQQLDADGHIVQQTPASSVLAYLRNGLTIDGYPKQSTTA